MFTLNLHLNLLTERARLTRPEVSCTSQGLLRCCLRPDALWPRGMEQFGPRTAREGERDSPLPSS